MAAGDIISLQLDQSIFGDQILNTFYYEVVTDGPDPSKNEDDLAAQFEIDVIPLWEPCVVADLSFDCIGTQKVFPVAEKTAFRELFLTAVGSAVGESIPIVATALLQKFNPAVTGQGKKGHVNISGISEADTELGRIDGSLNGRLFALADKLTENLITVGLAEFAPGWATFTAPPVKVDGIVKWLRTVVLPRLAHIGTRKTPIRKLAP